MTTRITGALTTFVCAAALCATSPVAAQEKVGVVTTAIGPVTVVRAALPPEPLKFKDGVFLHDRVTTGEDAITRILLGGKVVVTARERTTLTITETPGLSTIDLSTGRIAVAVEKALMKPGERVDIRTPNAVAGVRGTVLFVEAAGDRSTITVTRGLVHVTRLDSVRGVPVGPFTAVGANQTVSVRKNVLPARPATIAVSRALELANEFTPPLRAATSAAVVHDTHEARRVLAQPGFAGLNDSPEPTAPGLQNAIERQTPGLPPASSARVASPVLASTPAPALVSTPMALPASAPALVSTPMALPASVPALVPTPMAPPAPNIKTNVPNYGQSFLQSAGKGGKDRSGSNSGKN